MEKIKVTKNITGKIDKNNRLYKDEDRDSLDKLYPEEDGKEMIGIKQNRKRYASKADIPEYLPTLDIMPYPIDETDHIGHLETKKNLYLVLATALNNLTDRIKFLEQEVELLKNQ